MHTMRERVLVIGNRMFNVAGVGFAQPLSSKRRQHLGSAVQRLIPPLHRGIDIQWIFVTITNLAILWIVRSVI